MNKMLVVTLWIILGICGFIYVAIELGFGIAVAFWAMLFSQNMVRKLTGK